MGNRLAESVSGLKKFNPASVGEIGGGLGCGAGRDFSLSDSI